MRRHRSLIAASCLAMLAAGVLLSAGQLQLPSEPPRQFGTSITGAFEGWFETEGGRQFLVGYLNRNLKEPMDVPIGPNNRIEPGGPDLGQPSHFEPGRQTGMFLVRVPQGFTDKDRLTWTIVANGQSTSVPFYRIPTTRSRHSEKLPSATRRRRWPSTSAVRQYRVRSR